MRAPVIACARDCVHDCLRACVMLPPAVWIGSTPPTVGGDKYVARTPAATEPSLSCVSHGSQPRTPPCTVGLACLCSGSTSVPEIAPIPKKTPRPKLPPQDPHPATVLLACVIACMRDCVSTWRRARSMSEQVCLRMVLLRPDSRASILETVKYRRGLAGSCRSIPSMMSCKPHVCARAQASARASVHVCWCPSDRASVRSRVRACVCMQVRKSACERSVRAGEYRVWPGLEGS